MWVDILLLAALMLIVCAAVLLSIALPYLAARKIWTAFTRRMAEPDTHGDDGGRPADALKWRAGDMPRELDF